MKLGSKPGLAAGIVVLALAAGAPTAFAGPTVTARVEGAAGTLLERTAVTLPDTPSPVNGCPAGSVAAAIEVATHGNWDRAPFTQTILGEIHSFSTDGAYWAEWVDGGAGYKYGNGVCADLLKSGDEVLMLYDKAPYGEDSQAEVPLELHAADAVRGVPLTVQVTGAVIRDFTQAPPLPAASEPIKGATVSGGGLSAVTGDDGRAVLTFDRTGPVTLKASKPDTVPSGATTIQVTDTPQAGAPPAGTLPDRLAPTAKLLGIADRQVFAKGKGPRTIRASAPDPSGLAAVKLRLTRRSGGRCSYFSGRREQLEPTRCGRAFFFKVGEQADVSYLLPQRLGPGRYVLDLAAIDRAGNRAALARGSTRVVFTVR